MHVDYIKLIGGHFISVYRSFVANFYVKALLAYLVVVFHYLFGASNTELVLAVFLLVAFDFVTGIMGAFRSGEVVSSRKALKSATKVIAYGMFLSSAQMMSVIMSMAGFLPEAVAAFLGLTEFLSIIENIAKMGFNTPKKLLNIDLKSLAHVE